MRATELHAPYDIRIGERPDPHPIAGTDAVAHTSVACVCGSDLWWYRGVNEFDRPRRIGHELVGTVIEVGTDRSQGSSGFRSRTGTRTVSWSAAIRIRPRRPAASTMGSTA